MNRRDLLRAFAVGAAGLMLPVVDPARKVWALDRTMMTGRFDASMPSFEKAWYGATYTLPTELSEDHAFIVTSGNDILFTGQTILMQCHGPNDWRLVG